MRFSHVVDRSRKSVSLMLMILSPNFNGVFANNESSSIFVTDTQYVVRDAPLAPLKSSSASSSTSFNTSPHMVLTARNWTPIVSVETAHLCGFGTVIVTGWYFSILKSDSTSNSYRDEFVIKL